MWLLWGQDFRALSVDKTKASPYIPPNALQGINIPRTSKELTTGLEETKSEEHPVQREHHLYYPRPQRNPYHGLKRSPVCEGARHGHVRCLCDVSSKPGRLQRKRDANKYRETNRQHGLLPGRTLRAGHGLWRAGPGPYPCGASVWQARDNR